MRNRNIFVGNVILVVSILLFCFQSWAGVDISLEVATREKDRVDRAAVSLKKGLQNFGEKIAEIGPSVYKVKAEIDQYKGAGQWDKLPPGEKAYLLASSLEAVGRLEMAFSENLQEILRGMETYEKAVGEAIVATTIIKGANQDVDYFINQRIKTIKVSFKAIEADPEVKDAKETLKSSKCRNKKIFDSECSDARLVLQDYRLKLASLMREWKILTQKKRLAEMNQQLAAIIQGKLTREGPYASRLFRQVIDTWIDLASNMELLRKMPIDAITGKDEEDKTRKMISLADNMIKMGDDLIDVVNGSVDTVVNNFGQISGIAVPGGGQSIENILDSTESAEQNLARALGQ